MTKDQYEKELRQLAIKFNDLVLRALAEGFDVGFLAVPISEQFGGDVIVRVDVTEGVNHVNGR